MGYIYGLRIWYLELYMYVKVAQLCPILCHPMPPHSLPLYSPWNSPGQNIRVGSCSLFQGSSQPRGWIPGLPHCRQILYQLSYQESSRILEWVPYPFSTRSFWPRNWTGVSCIAGGFFTSCLFNNKAAEKAVHCYYPLTLRIVTLSQRKEFSKQKIF